MKKVLCNISGNDLPIEIDDSQQRTITYGKLLEFFDEVHFVNRSKKFNETVKHPDKPIYIHHVKTKPTIIGRIVGYCRIFLKAREIDKKYNVTVNVASEPITGGLVCYFLRTFYGKPYMLEVQAELMQLPAQIFGKIGVKVIKFITKLTSKKASITRAVSEEIKKQLVNGGVVGTKIRVITSRVSLVYFDCNKYLPQERIDLRTALCVSEEEKLLLFVGRFVPSKGIPILFNALESCVEYNFKLVIVGEGEMKDDLINTVESNVKLKDKIQFVNSVPFTEVSKYMYASDIFVLSSLDEGFPRVILEAMAMKRLIVSTKVGGINDICDENVNGIYCMPNDVKGLSDALVQAINISPERNDILTNNAYQMVLNKYEFNVAMEHYINAFKEILTTENIQVK